MLIPRITEESIPNLGTEQNDMKKIGFTKNPNPANRIDSVFLSETCVGTEFREFAFIFVPRNGILSCFLLKWFRTGLREFAFICVPWYRIPCIFLLCRMVRNEIPRVFCSKVQPEFDRNNPIVPSFAEEFFCWKLPTLSLGPILDLAKRTTFAE